MKRLISAQFVREESLAGKKRIECLRGQCIITPEARSVADELGMQLVDEVSLASPCECPPAAGQDDLELAAIRKAVMARLPAGTVPDAVLDQLIKKAASEHKAERAPPAAEGTFKSQTMRAGIKCVAGDSVKLGIFDGAGKDSQVGIADVVTAADGSSMAAGFMAWENCFFPWTLTYDEVDLVLDGELHIRCGGETVVGRAGDVIFIPKNSSIEFGTPSHVRFLYVAYPANWQEA